MCVYALANILLTAIESIFVFFFSINLLLQKKIRENIQRDYSPDVIICQLCQNTHLYAKVYCTRFCSLLFISHILSSMISIWYTQGRW